MRFIPSRVHAVVDYLLGAFLLWSPWLFRYSDNSAAMWVPIVLGAAVILYSLFTEYELGVFSVIPYHAHLVLDVIGGITLAVSPWLFRFSGRVWAPHLIIGVAEIIFALLSKPRPSNEITT